MFPKARVVAIEPDPDNVDILSKLHCIVAITSPPAQDLRSLAKPGYVQYGCGWSAPKEWTNFDASLTLKWERLPILGRYTKNSQHFPVNVRPGDIVKGLPVPDEAVRAFTPATCLSISGWRTFRKLSKIPSAFFGKAGFSD
jgi:hypothetical protein